MIRILVLIAAQFTIARTWKPPKCPSTGMGKEDVVHTQWAVTHPKINEIMPFTAMWLGLETVILNDVSQTKTYTI